MAGEMLNSRYSALGQVRHGWKEMYFEIRHKPYARLLCVMLGRLC